MKQYKFRNYTIHTHPDLIVVIGNDETDLILYTNRTDYALLAWLSWHEENESVHIVNRWKLTFEHDTNHNIYIHYNPDYHY
ncbi:hypothetical protein [Streptococcus ruminantium]|uniref:hypothetical protein n=1 Tax=Streptococcus ruminantium TaxID=1917441 RepID=UPI0012DE6E93|nr:hypothetical protein [Streptococcus ruminantium]